MDVGSTFTKVAVVDVDGGALLATAQHPTTVATDVLHGVDAAVAAAASALPAGVGVSEVVACSSAGGGLRLAVVGYEELVSARAAGQVALSAGARVVHVAAGRLDAAGVAGLRAARPDVVLLVGGTDGGDEAVLRHNAARLASARLRVPVVVAGNVAARDDVVAALSGRGVPVVAADNVLPRIGVISAASARAAIRDVFLRHVIGGKRLSRGPRFGRLVRAATPQVVLDGVEVLADLVGADVAVVDVGGATTDVYSVLRPDAHREQGPAREVAGVLWHSRSVEGDLGVRWSAPGVVAAAAAERLIGDDADLAQAGAVRAADPALIDPGWVVDGRLAALAATVALRRHARGDVVGGRRSGGRDLSGLALVVGSGGVLRHAPAGRAHEVVRSVLADHAGGWVPPRDATVVVDTRYVLAAAGLLAQRFPRAAAALLRRELLDAVPATAWRS